VSGTTRSEFKAALSEIANAFRRQIEAGVDGFEADPQASRARVLRAQDDPFFFAKTYFPHYVKSDPSVVHTHMFEAIPKAIAATAGAREYVVAPRGEAKTTILQILSLWCALTKRKKFIVMIADAATQADTMLEAVKAELEVNPRLAMDYPDHVGKGPLWREGVAITNGQVKFQAFGAGKRMRGVRHGPHRPDLTLVDDIENDEQVRSPEQRDKRQRWLSSSVLSLGAADDSMDVIYVGTILHYDSVLARTVRNSLWHGKVFRAILRWPDDMDAWDQWEALLKNEGEAAGRAFYAAHKPAMDAGAVVSWPSVRPLYNLMVKRARDGHAAFDSEQQNDPSAGDAAPLASSIHEFGGVTPGPHWAWFGAVDPSLGKAGASRDPSAILVGAFDRIEKRLYVFSAEIKKRLPALIIADVIKAQKQYRCVVWAVEAVQFQEFLRTEIIRQSLAVGIPVPARAVIPLADKLLRIESLQPFMASKNILIHSSCSTLIEQLKHFPLGDHDDGPDALHMLWMLASTSFSQIEFQSSSDLDRDHERDDEGDARLSFTRESW
jgi:predicted phage terminase large subunit-like protein